MRWDDARGHKMKRKHRWNNRLKTTGCIMCGCEWVDLGVGVCVHVSVKLFCVREEDTTQRPVGERPKIRNRFHITGEK